MFAHMIEICVKNSVKDKCIVIGKDLFEEALKIREEMIKRGDLTTRWWRRFMIAIFTPANRGARVNFGVTTTTGASTNATMKQGANANVTITDTYYCNSRFWISVGNSSKSPTVDDSSLYNKITEGLASITSDDSAGVIVLSAGFQFSTDTVINEVGLEYEGYIAGISDCGRILIDRTVISGGFTAPANTPITVTYRILV